MKLRPDTFWRNLLASGDLVPPRRIQPERTPLMHRLINLLALAFAIGLILVILLVLFGSTDGHSQTKLGDRKPVPQLYTKPVRCWPIANGEAATIVCDNGWWSTTMPDGMVIEGNGVQDPNAAAQGSRIAIDPGTSRPTGAVIPPEPLATPGPGQWYYGGTPVGR